MKTVWRKLGVLSEAECAFDAEALYTLWRCAKAGAEIKVPVKVLEGVKIMRNILELDGDATFKDFITDTHDPEPQAKA